MDVALVAQNTPMAHVHTAVRTEGRKAAGSRSRADHPSIISHTSSIISILANLRDLRVRKCREVWTFTYIIVRYVLQPI